MRYGLWQIEASTPDPENKSVGNFEVSVDISPSCNLSYDDKKFTELSSLLAVQLEK